MRLIADGGSTKVSWALIDGDRVHTFTTGGLNPSVMTADELLRRLRAEFQLPPHAEVTEVEFYGAGCRGAQPLADMRDALQAVTGAERIIVESDMLGACRAVLGNKPGIVAILGTGANSCFYDGNAIILNASPGGYILGDEFSGAWIGKQIAADFIKGLLPAELAEKFTERFHLDADEIIRRVYRPDPSIDTAPNRFLASLAPFTSEHISHPHIAAIIERGAALFVERNLLTYPEGHPVHFVGSVAIAFRPQLTAALASRALTPGLFLPSPLSALTRPVQLMAELGH